jgi:tight adherence protein B
MTDMTGIVAGLLVLVGVGAATYAFTQRRARRVADLKQVLEMTYLDQAGGADARTTGALLARSGELAERALGRTRLLDRLADVVRRSQWNISPGELVVVSVLGAVIGAVVGAVIGGVVFAIVLAAIVLVTPYLLCSRAVRKRLRRFETQLPDVLDLLAASLEGGAGVAQALEVVAQEAEEPVASEFGQALNATRLGIPLAEALEEMASRLGSTDLHWTVRAIVVQQQTGGKLADVLRIVSGVMRSREEIRRETAALTAEGRLSAYILGALPVLLFGFLALVRRDYIRPLYTTGAGAAMLILAVVLMGISFVAMRKIVRIEV